LGRTFPEALNKAIQSLEIGVDALDGSGPSRELPAGSETFASLNVPTADRLFRVYRAIRQGNSLHEIAKATGYDLWFLAQLKEIETRELEIRNCKTEEELQPILRSAKQMGFADSHIARLLTNYRLPITSVRDLRKQFGILPTFQRVDTCAANSLSLQRLRKGG
jgi:carbamoyl-phosphate synthase large subunit